jgi:transcriptional regulator with XRE-family HTH domain
METTNSFGYWIRRQRKALDLTQQALAERVGCSLAAIKKIEQDERRPSRQVAGLLADVLGVPASQREVFLEVARGIRPVNQLVFTYQPATSTLPTGIVTFLFTDIEESTKLAQESAENWEILRARHHAILRETMEAHHGYVFQIIGDAFCVAFDTANEAFHAAVEAQRKLQSENWGEAPLNVRMGIHTGEAEVHGNEYYGT